MALTKVSRGLLSTGIVDNSNATAITIDSSENVGIGMTPASTVVLDIKEADASTDLILGLTAGTGGRVQIRSVAQSDGTSSVLSFLTMSGSSTSEAMRIASDGNVLVGQTANASSSAGTILTGSGVAFHTRDGGVSLVCSRLTDNGSIAQFRKGSTTIGEIGTASDLLTVGSGDAGLIFNSTADAIYPWNISTNAGNDNAIDLGISNRRIKNIYVSSGIYLGGTGSANHLDDYEEGSWTSTTTGITGVNVTAANYIKIGRLVAVDLRAQWTGSTNDSTALTFSLPFTANNPGGASRTGIVFYAGTSILGGNAISAHVSVGGTVVSFYNTGGGTFRSILASDVNGSYDWLVSFFYFTDS